MQSWIFSINTVTWSFRSHNNMLIWCFIIINVETSCTASYFCGNIDIFFQHFSIMPISHGTIFSKSSDHRCFHTAWLSGVAFSRCCVHTARWISDRRLHTARLCGIAFSRCCVHTARLSGVAFSRCCVHTARLSGVAFSHCCVHTARWIGDRRLHTARLCGVAFSRCCVHTARWIGDRRLHTAWLYNRKNRKLRFI